MRWNDVGYALRLLRRSPGFTAVAVLSLALGIGANTAIYSLFYTIMLRPLPVSHPEELVELVRNSAQERHWDGYWAWDEFQYFRDRNHVFSAMTGSSFDNLAWVHIENAEPETRILESVPVNYFTLLGLKPAIGRFPESGDVPARGDGDVVVLSWSYWNRRFHRDPRILGRHIWYNDERKTVVGVGPRTYLGPRVGSETDLWMPSDQFGLIMLARLKPEVTLARAQAEIDALFHAYRLQTTGRRDQRRMELLPASAGFARVRDRYGKALVLVFTVVGLLLLLACINMAGMLLARSAARQREIAVRVGLGASRVRLMRQMLTESVLLSSASALIGVVVAYLATGALVRILASARAFEHIDVEVRPDPPILLFTVAIALLTGLLFGLAPAWYAFRSAPAAGLRQTGKGDTRLWRWFGRSLVAAQVALSILLVTAASVFLNHLQRLRNFDLGFRSDHVLLVKIDTSHSAYSRDQLTVRNRELLEKLERIPGVTSASVSGCTPLEGCGSGARYISAEGRLEPPGERHWNPITFVGPGYFETLGIPLLAGRDFGLRDSGQHTAVVNRMLARKYFGGADPIGRHFSLLKNPPPPPWAKWPTDDQSFEIIGVVGDSKADDLRIPPSPTIYFDLFQERQLPNQVELRTSASPRSVAADADRVLASVLPGIPIKRITTLSDQVDSNIVPERLIATLSEFFGVLGATLAAIGLYGILAYTVARRTNEIGVRMALGATAFDVGRMVLRDALSMVAAGLAAGAWLLVWSRPLAAKLVPDLTPANAGLVAATGGLTIAIALLASYVPARRAVRIDPMAALRHE